MSRCRAPATACRNGTLVLMACLLLAACAGQPVREAPPVASGAATATQEAREAALREVDAWSLEGRVALANDGRGGSGRLDWHQAGTRSTVSLSAPITRQSWRLTAGPGGATLEGMEGGSRQGLDAAGLLLDSTGWQIPIGALPSWLRGARSPTLGAAVLAYGEDGRLARMEQGGWTVTYTRWGLPHAGGGAVALPHRLEAVRGEARVRLIVDAWTHPGDADADAP